MEKMKKRRLTSVLLIALMVFLAALPVHASSSQFVDLYPGMDEVQSRWHEGTEGYFYVNHIRDPWPNNEEFSWYLVDYYNNVLDSGVVTYNGTSYVDGYFQLTADNGYKARLILDCNSVWCRGDGYIETWN